MCDGMYVSFDSNQASFVDLLDECRSLLMCGGMQVSFGSNQASFVGLLDECRSLLMCDGIQVSFDGNEVSFDSNEDSIVGLCCDESKCMQVSFDIFGSAQR